MAGSDSSCCAEPSHLAPPHSVSHLLSTLLQTLLARCGSATRSSAPADSAVRLQSLKKSQRTTDGPTHLWALSSAESPRPKSWAWMVRSDAAAAGLEGSEVPSRRLKGARRRRDTEEEADQTREADWEEEEK